MAFRIETAARGRFTTFILSGRIEKEAIAELRKLFERRTDYRDIVLDPKDVSVIDRDARHCFVRCEADGVTLENCVPFCPLIYRNEQLHRKPHSEQSLRLAEDEKKMRVDKTL